MKIHQLKLFPKLDEKASKLYSNKHLILTPKKSKLEPFFQNRPSYKKQKIYQKTDTKDSSMNNRETLLKRIKSDSLMENGRIFRLSQEIKNKQAKPSFKKYFNLQSKFASRQINQVNKEYGFPVLSESNKNPNRPRTPRMIIMKKQRQIRSADERKRPMCNQLEFTFGI